MSKTTVIAEPGTYEIVIERVFDASRERVYKAYTDAKAFSRWWSPSWLTVEVEQLDARNGGSWRVIQRDANGNAYGFHGVFHTCTSPETVVRTMEFEGMPGHVLLETLKLEALPNGQTKVRTQSVFQSVEARDGMLQSGAAKGAEETWDRLDELLAEG